jgi:NUMOD3 motif-containing protein
MFYTYMWLRENGTPYYVGKGSGDRAYIKHRVGNAPPLDRIVFYIAKDEADAFDIEVSLIWYYGRKDAGTGCLRNLTGGGEGPSGATPWNKGISPSEEMRNRIRKKLLGNTPWNKGVKTAQEVWNKGLKGAQVAWNKGQPMSEEACTKMSQSRLGKEPWNKGIGMSREEKRTAHNVASKKHRDKKKAQERLNEQPIRS